MMDANYGKFAQCIETLVNTSLHLTVFLGYFGFMVSVLFWAVAAQ